MSTGYWIAFAVAASAALWDWAVLITRSSRQIVAGWHLFWAPLWTTVALIIVIVGHAP
jgi:hypothetical protein